MVSKSGRKDSAISFSPPIMIDSRASRAPMSPPETGALNPACTNLAFASWKISWAKAGSLVVMSTTTEPGLAPEKNTVFPEDHFSDVSGVAHDGERHVRGLCHLSRRRRNRGPFSGQRLGFFWRSIVNGRRYPASIRCPHIDEPMTPVPIQPIRVFPGAMSSAMAGSKCNVRKLLRVTQDDGSERLGVLFCLE